MVICLSLGLHHDIVGAVVAITFFIVFSLFRSCECVLYQIRQPLSTLPVPNRFAFLVLPHVVVTSGDVGGFVNFLPLAVASEPRPPLVHLGVEPDTGSLVVHLLAAEALVARHE